MEVPTALATRLADVRDTIRSAAERSGRDARGIRLVAVTKSAGVERTLELVRLGQTDLGESRADVLGEKARAAAAAGLAVRWHFVGHLQSNKARRVVEHADVLHSIDGARLLDAVERHARDLGKRVECFVQVKLYAEDTKSGLDPAALGALLDGARSNAHAVVVGLMTMAPLVEDARESERLARDVFTRCAALAREHATRFAAPPRLSMGMSDDFEIAIACGSTDVRVGTRLVGAPGEIA